MNDVAEGTMPGCAHTHGTAHTRNKRKVGRLPPAFEKNIPITSNGVWPIRALTAGVVDKQTINLKTGKIGLPLELDLLGVAGLGETVLDPPLLPAAAAGVSFGGRLSSASSSSELLSPPAPVCFFIRAWISFPVRQDRVGDRGKETKKAGLLN